MKKTKYDTKITPKRLILSLLSSPGIEQIDVILLIEWGKLFNIDPATTRVAVARLAKQGFISSVSRGRYTIGPNGKMLANAASSWVDAQSKIGPWSGQWLVVHTAHLGRTNKTAVRSRERAMRLNGFVSPLAGLWCRPANFTEPLLQTKDRLTSMGLEAQAVLMHCDAFSGIELDALYQLWPVAKIKAEYLQISNNMRESSAHLENLNINDAVRETFLVGESVIKQINADPLLPDEIIDSQLRGETISQMKQYSEQAGDVWEQFHASI